jgi:hypothetical protein
MLAGRNDVEEEPDQQDDLGRPGQTINLDSLSRFMAYGVAVAVTLLLAVTTHDYLGKAYPTHAHVPLELAWSVGLSPVAVGIASVALSWYRSQRVKANASPEVAGIFFKVSAYGILAYAVVGPLFAGVVETLSKAAWNKAALAIAVTSVCCGLFVPSLLLVALVQSVPPLAEDRKRDPAGNVRPEVTAVAPATHSASELPNRDAGGKPTASAKHVSSTVDQLGELDESADPTPRHPARRGLLSLVLRWLRHSSSPSR